jgi:5-methyltetrahydrofolate--homocysteine methyltransferase
MDTQLNFTPDDWARVARDTTAWWNHELDRPLVYLAVPGRASAQSAWGYQSNYPLDLSAEEVVDRYAPALASARYYADAFPCFWVNFGPGIAAGFLGAQVNSVTNPSETVWFTPARRLLIADLNLEYDAQNVWWRRVKEITLALVQRYNGMLQVGHADLGGNLDILASLVTTEQLLYDVTDNPDEVVRLVRQVTSLWIRYYAELNAIIRPTCHGTSAWTPIWSPGRTYMLQCDFAYMISPRMFERFVVPDLEACCAYLDHGFYHLDGKGQIPHLQHLLKIERLKGIQWIPGDGQPSPDQWLDLLKQIRDGGKLCQVFVSPQGARRIVKNLGGKGFLLVVSADAAFQDPDQVHAFLKTLREEDIHAPSYTAAS